MTSFRPSTADGRAPNRSSISRNASSRLISSQRPSPLAPFLLKGLRIRLPIEARFSAAAPMAHKAPRLKGCPGLPLTFTSLPSSTNAARPQAAWHKPQKVGIPLRLLPVKRLTCAAGSKDSAGGSIPKGVRTRVDTPANPALRNPRRVREPFKSILARIPSYKGSKFAHGHQIQPHEKNAQNNERARSQNGPHPPQPP